MRDVTLVILNSLRIKCHIRRPLNIIHCTAMRWLSARKMPLHQYFRLLLLDNRDI